MAELIEVSDIPEPRRGRGTIYPWGTWLRMVQNGKALKLSRGDMPKDSNAYRNWSKFNARTGALGTARSMGLHVASRGDHIYLWWA